jgi:hypothetical protein
MGDYISKSALIEALEKSMKENNHKSMIGYAEHIQEHRYLIHLVEKQPTLDEKEIIRKPFERVVERLEERKDHIMKEFVLADKAQEVKSESLNRINELDGAIEIVKEECGISE